MLSYRHAFHAGNHADVLKHAVLTLVIEYLKQKEKPFWYIDTHAGAGVYTLDSSEAKKNAEFKTGIERLLDHRDELPDLLQPYLLVIDELRRAQNGEGLRRGYPGSPMFAEYLLRDDDRLRLFELHPQDVELLKDNFERDRRVLVAHSDGFAGLKALLPPPPRRAVVLIDPSYELKEDYALLVDSLGDALRRFATGTYLIWYPLLPRRESLQLPERLMALGANSLRIELQIKAPEGEFGMYGSGMFVINPPWLLREQMNKLLPLFVELLGHAPDAKWVLESSDDNKARG